MASEVESFNEQTLDDIADALSDQGYIVVSSCLSSGLLTALQAHCENLSDNTWQQSGIGRHNDKTINSDIRRDKTKWLTNDDATEKQFLSSMETLRQGLNRRLFLGLFDYESHFASYEKGAFYQKHIDTLKGQGNRIVSTVTYLNSDWCEVDAGQLQIYSDDGDEVLQTIAPKIGTMVIFLSEKIPHEVLAANRHRMSIAGWFRVNLSDSHRVDPSA